MVHRDKPPGGGLDVFWFTARGKSKHGAHLDPTDEGIGTTDHHHPYIGFLPIKLVTNTHTPTARVIKKFMFKNRYHKVDLYLSTHKDNPLDNDDTVDLDKYGLTKDHPILLVDRNHDRTEAKEEKDERDVESIDRHMDENAKYKHFTKRLKNITHGDWGIYPEAIKHTFEGEILWTDGHSNHSFASAPTIQAYKVVRREPNDRHGMVVAHGLASASPYYFQLLD